MKAIKYQVEWKEGTGSVGCKAQINPKNPKEIELKVKDGNDVYYVKLSLGDLFNLIAMLANHA